MSFFSLVLHNLGVKKVRSALTALAVAVGVLTVVTLGLVNHSIRSSALALLQTGRADFTVAQKGVSDILNSNVDEADVARIKAMPGVADAIGALISATKLNADNPLFLQIGVPPDALDQFGVTVLEGKPYAANAQDEILLGYRAAKNLGKKVGDHLTIDTVDYRIVGLYSTGQALGDTGAMMPLSHLQEHARQPGEVTLVFVQVTQGTNVAALRKQIDEDNPQLTTVRTATDFGRADRSLQLINAADQGSRVLAVAIGALIVMSMMTMAFIERIREFGVLSAIGWPRRRVLGLVLAEAGMLGAMGAAAGVGLSFLATKLLQQSSMLRGVVQVVYTTDTFWRAIYTAAGMTVLGALYPALRAASLAPLEALRRE